MFKSIIEDSNFKTIYILATLQCTLLIYFYGNQWAYDTESYINAWDNISVLKIDIWRTPVYPIFLGIGKALFGANHYLFVCTIIQHIIFLISIFYFQRLSMLVTNSRSISFWLCAIYALYPCVPTWNCFNQTEAFAIASMTFMLYFAVAAFEKQSLENLFAFTLWLIVHVFLRPSQMYIPLVFLTSWAFIFIAKKKKRYISIKGIIASLAVCALVGCYAYIFSKSYDMYIPSGIGVLNKYYMARRDGLLTSSDVENPKLKSFIQEREEYFKSGKGTVTDLFEESEKVINTFGLRQINETITKSEEYSAKSVFRTVTQRFFKAASEAFMFTYIPDFSRVTDIIGFRLNIVFVLLFIFPFAIFWQMKKAQTFPVISATIYLIGLFQFFISVVLCQNEWGRLILPAISAYLLLFGLIARYISIKNETPIML